MATATPERQPLPPGCAGGNLPANWFGAGLPSRNYLDLDDTGHTLRLPEAGEQAVAHRGDVVRPSGVSREYPFLGVDTV